MKLFTKKKTSTNPHYGDSMRWIEKAIDSCETVDQVRTAGRLIRLFEELYYGELEGSELRSISRSLHIRSIEKWGEVVEKEINKKKEKKTKDKKK
jgi:hypothetical protein